MFSMQILCYLLFCCMKFVPAGLYELLSTSKELPEYNKVADGQ